MEKYIYNEKLLVRKMEETTMIYNPDNGDMYELNDISQIILEKIQDGKTLGELISHFCIEYDEAEDVISEDVFEVCKRFEKLGIIMKC